MTYRYHVAIENHIAPHHWTEKLADPLLAYTLPFYYGCPNAAEYIPEESFIPIDIFKFGEACERISKAIRDQEYEKRLPAIREARRRVLEDYSTFAQLSRLIQERHDLMPPGTEQQTNLLSRHAWRARHPIETAAWALTKGLIQARSFCTNRKFNADS